MSEITHVQIPVGLVNATLEYLKKRPFDEVFDIIVNLKQHAEESFTKQQQEQERSDG